MVSAVARLSVEYRDATAWVRLDRPAVRNAIDVALRRELAEALAALAVDERLHALVLTGNGSAFCAGGDLTDLAAADGTGSRDRLTAGNRMVRALFDFPVPTVAAVNGVAAGAGCGLVLACDVVLAAESAWFQMSFVGMGLGPDAGTSALLPARVGVGRARSALLLGERLTAAEAHAAGLVDRVVPDDRLAAEAELLAERFARSPRPALVATKYLLNRGLGLGAALEAEADSQVLLLSGPEHRAARDRFLSRRATREA